MRDVNIIIDPLPTSITVGNDEIDINTDFRYCIMFEQMLSDNTISESAKFEIMLELFFDNPNIEITDFKQLTEQIVWFYRCGKKMSKKEQADAETERDRENGTAPPAIYDYDYDADLIFSAFMQQYRIDLNDAELHWWKFKSLFVGLDSETTFKQIVHIRSIKTSEIKDVKERQRIQKLQAEHKIPVELTDEQKIAMAGNMFGGGF